MEMLWKSNNKKMLFITLRVDWIGKYADKTNTEGIYHTIAIIVQLRPAKAISACEIFLTHYLTGMLTLCMLNHYLFQRNFH